MLKDAPSNELQNDIVKKRFSVFKKKASIEAGIDVAEQNLSRVLVQD